MKTKFTLLTCWGILMSTWIYSQLSKTSSFRIPENIPGNWYETAAAEVKQMEYAFYPDGDRFRVANSDNGIFFSVDESGYTVKNLQEKKNGAGWFATIRLVSIGRQQPQFHFSKAESNLSEGDMLVHRFGFADVEYLNNESGLRQNFIVREKPDGNGELKVELELASSLSHQLLPGNHLVFHSPGNERDIKLRYDDLNVWDATNRKLNAHMELADDDKKLLLVVDDRNARYPVTIDPLNHNPEWSTSADGIVPGLLNTLALQVNSLYGFTVANLGDINGDTYDDVAIGAPGMANVVTGAGNLLGVGAVFIYRGSPTGLSTSPNKVLQPTTALAGALFGFSIEAGNISADGLQDVIVGAPMDTYQTTVTGLFGNQNVDVSAGKVYYYRSEDLLSASNPSPFVQIRLQGNNFFGIGILGLFDNTGIKALFGYSIGVTNDLNGDGRQDIVIGCPNYLGKNIGDIQSGAAFVYYSNGLNTTSPVQLNVPTPSILGLVTLPLANLNGLLFGFSVEGAGDYNNDGRPDLVVGAPAGINLNSLGGIFTGQVLGGSAYVYYGTGSGVNTSIGATLQASPSGLLSSAANLFGYKIKTLKNAAGLRSGSILVGAVSGSVISNVVGGLRLKAGQVHLFRKKTTAFTSPISSDQALSSPRSSSVLNLLTGQNLNVSLLFGASIDNMRDVNCDGNADIIIGEPLSTTVPIIGGNVTGGAAYTYLGLGDGTFQSTPSWSSFSEVSPLLGVNATSLFGFSVAGGIHSHGPAGRYRTLVGGPTNALDFSSGLLNLGNTLGTLFGFAFDNNGIGKAYSFETNLCLITLPVTIRNFSGRVNAGTVQLDWVSENESNINRYELERSTDGVNFNTMAIVFAQNGQRSTYAYPDAHPVKGVNYYRLKIIDDNSKTEFSKTISFHFGEKYTGVMTVAPNPAREFFRVSLSGITPGSYSLRLHNSAGQLVTIRSTNVVMDGQQETFPRTAAMRPGLYWLNLYDNKGKIVRTVNLMIGD